LTEFPDVLPQEADWTPPSGFATKVDDWDALIAGYVAHFWQGLLCPDVRFGMCSLDVDRSVPEVTWCTPGTKAGKAALTEFLSRLGKYAKERNNPSLPGERCSGVCWLRFRVAPSREQSIDRVFPTACLFSSPNAVAVIPVLPFWPACSAACGPGSEQGNVTLTVGVTTT
jgi:hypothetical protein